MAAEPDSTTYRCTTCGCQTLPPLFSKVIAEFEALSEREKKAVMHLLSGFMLYGKIPDRGWTNEVADCVRVFLPSFFEAREIGSVEDLLIAANDPEWERPEGWSRD